VIVMEHYRKFAGLGVACLLATSQAAMAAQWQICQMRVEITGVTKPVPQLQAKVRQVTPKQADAECPQVGDTITFDPETPDYQNNVPRKRWPKIGQTVRMRYQYLDGFCHHEEGQDAPCRIKHYPLDAS
jgi:hypothetical protein